MLCHLLSILPTFVISGTAWAAQTPFPLPADQKIQIILFFYPITDFHIGPQVYVNCRVSTPLWVESTSNIQRDNTWWHLVVRGLAVHSCGLFYKASNGAPSGLIVSITLGPTDNEANKIAFWLRLRVHGAPWSISPPAGRSVSVPLLDTETSWLWYGSKTNWLWIK